MADCSNSKSNTFADKEAAGGKACATTTAAIIDIDIGIGIVTAKKAQTW